MSNSKNTRRQFLTSTGVTLSAGWAALNMPVLLAAGKAAQAGLENDEDYNNITAEQAIELAAFADQIIPPGDTPGGAEIGVVYFMDGVIGGFMAGTKPKIEAGLHEWNQKAQTMNPDVERFSQLSKPEQTALLQGEEQSPVFGVLRTMVLYGMFSSPQYGGNRNEAGWKLIGFDKQHVWSPPFGYYDAQAMGSDQYAEGQHVEDQYAEHRRAGVSNV